MSKKIGLADARKNLPELTDRAYAGSVYRITRRGRELAVILGVDEYQRLKEIEQQQRMQDFDALLAPPESNALSEDEARLLAVEIVRMVRQES